MAPGLAPRYISLVTGALTTILSVLPLIRHPSYVIITFSKMIFLVILLGLLHGLLLLPILLTLFGPGACRLFRSAKRKETVYSSPVNILSPLTSVSDTFIYEDGKFGLRQYSLKRTVCVSPEILRDNFILMKANEKCSAVTAASDLHLSFFRPAESEESDCNLSTDYDLPIKVS